MLIPAAMFIEEAVDQLKAIRASGTTAALNDQRKELEEATGDYAGSEFSQGYELGLQTARVILMQSPKAVAAGVSDIL